jgi:hypothetical protein
MIFGSLGVVGFIIALCFAAGFLVSIRAAKTRSGVILLGLLFGVVFLIALSGLAIAGCLVVISTVK